MGIETKIHNPNIQKGDWVISQFIDDEEKGLPLRSYYTGIYRLDRIEGNIVVLHSRPVGIEFDLDLENFARTGILGEERFTVIKDPSILNNPDAPNFNFDMNRVVEAWGLPVDKA